MCSRGSPLKVLDSFVPVILHECMLWPNVGYTFYSSSESLICINMLKRVISCVMLDIECDGSHADDLARVPGDTLQCKDMIR